MQAQSGAEVHFSFATEILGTNTQRITRMTRKKGAVHRSEVLSRLVKLS